MEQAFELGTYSQTVTATQPSEIYILDAKNYERLVEKRNKRTLEMLKTRAEMKLLFRIARSTEKVIPLVNSLVQKIIEEHKKSKTSISQSIFGSSSYGFFEASQSMESLQPQAATASVQTPRSKTQLDFIPEGGCLIDLYGPGTVFYRNRKKRESQRKMSQSQEIQQPKESVRNYNAAAAAMIGISIIFK